MSSKVISRAGTSYKQRSLNACVRLTKFIGHNDSHYSVRHKLETDRGNRFSLFVTQRCRCEINAGLPQSRKTWTYQGFSGLGNVETSKISRMTIFLDILSYSVCAKITFTLLHNTYLVITND